MIEFWSDLGELETGLPQFGVHHRHQELPKTSYDAANIPNNLRPLQRKPTIYEPHQPKPSNGLETRLRSPCP